MRSASRPRLGLPRSRRSRATTLVRHLGSGRVRARGSATGRLYEFARGESVEIAEVDVPKFVRTGLFVRD
ncbi:MAG TPA: hypothetical protein VIM33_02580 [Gaiellaceae bacterium]